MAGTGGKGGKPPKAFLGEDLGSELDAWDATFDALHEEPVAPASTDHEVGDQTSLTIDELSVGRDAPDHDEVELDAHADVGDATSLTLDPDSAIDDRVTMDAGFVAAEPEGLDTLDRELDARLPSPPRAPARQTASPSPGQGTSGRIEVRPTPISLGAETVASAAAYRTPDPDDPSETDFSDLGVEGAPRAAGSLLGADHKVPTNPAAKRFPTPAPVNLNEFDDEVFTSASRPAMPRAQTGGGFDDPVAPPPAPVPAQPRTRTGPAIIRRALPDLSRRDAPAGNDAGMFNEESTRVSSIDEIEAKRAESLRHQAAEAPRGRPRDEDEDDYEVEIDQANQTPPPSAGPPAAPLAGTQSSPMSPPPAEQSRRIAHVVRRADQQATKPPPSVPVLGGSGPRTLLPPDDDDDHVIEMEAGDDDDQVITTGELPPIPDPATPIIGRPTPLPAGIRPTTASGEDDFSDVAASFDEVGGAGADDPGTTKPPPIASIPVIPSRAGQHVVQRVASGPVAATPSLIAKPMAPEPDGLEAALEFDVDDEDPNDARRQRATTSIYEEDAAATAIASSRQARPTAPPPTFGAAPPPARVASPTSPPPLGAAPSGPIPTSPSGAVPTSPSGPVPTSPSGPIPRPNATMFGVPSAPTGAPEGVPRIKTPTSVPPLSSLAPTRTLAGVPIPTTTAESSRPNPMPGAVPTPAALAGAPVADVAPVLDLDAIGRAWPEEVAPIAATGFDEQIAQSLLVYEREIETVDDPAQSAALRNEAGRLSERLADLDRARGHYDAALLADPRATTALRGLRRIARASGDLAEATRHLEAEIAVAGGLERRPLGHYRIDLLMASGEQDLARVAVGEILDSAPSDVRALLAQLELAFLDGRADEFGSALEQLAHAVTDSELRAAVQSARGVLAAHHNDTAAAATFFGAAAESDPSSLSARLGAIRQAAAAADGPAAAAALVELARRVESTDAITAAAAALRAQQWATGDLATAAAQLAIASAPNDPLVARLAADTALAAHLAADKHAHDTAAQPPADEAAHADAITTATAAATEAKAAAAQAFARWARVATAPAEKAYASARAAELDPAAGIALWSQALALDANDDYAAAQLRTAYVAEEQVQQSIDVDLAVAKDPERDRARLRAAYGLIALGRQRDAIDTLAEGRAARPTSLALAEALGEALASAGQWSERAQLFSDLAAEAARGTIVQLDRDVATLRSALAWEEAVGAHAEAADAPENDQPDDAARKAAITAALDTWARVLEQSPGAPAAHAASLLLAKRLGDADVLGDALARAQAAEHSPWAMQTLALERARLTADPEGAEQILRDAAQTRVPPLDDPRRSLALMLAAAKQREIGDVAGILDERAQLLDQLADGAPTDDGADAAPAPSTEAATLRLRAAQLSLDAGDAVRATTLLGKVETALPQLGVVPYLLAAARRRSGDRPMPATAASARKAGGSSDAFARILRDADLAATHGDDAGALALYQRALELRPGDPLAAVPLVRTATQLRQAAPVADLALAQLRASEQSEVPSASDAAARASAYELLAHIDADLRNDPGSAQIALESASQADPSRVDLLHRLERTYAAGDQLAELCRLRAAILDTPEAARYPGDRAAILVDLAGLAGRDRRPENEVAEHYRAALAAEPKTRLALMHLEAIVRRAGFSQELADLEQKISDYFLSDPKAAATFSTRSGETLAEIGQIDVAVQRFGVAESLLAGHVPALEGWRQAALKGQLWVDVASAATRQAQIATEPAQQAALHHFAGVALMDKALAGDQAMPAFQAAIAADASHRDAFLRLRILLEEDGNHDDLAILLEKRLAHEEDSMTRMELHRALAELCRNFLSDRDGAKKHFRAILEIDPNDLRAHSALADIAWEQGAWQDAADALVARARLERQPDILKTLCFRLGLIYADYLVDVPMALKAFQSALTYAPDDENTLVRLADLATTAGEWKLALGACERLVKQEVDPDKRAGHLHRVARIFKNGFGDAKRAERALNLALDGAPTNDEALQTLVQFYKDANDITSARVHLNRVAGTMRARAAQAVGDGVAYRVISRSMSARAQTGVPGSLPIARAAAELAELLGAAGEPEKALLAQPPRPEIAPLLKPEADEVLFPKSMQPELRQLFALLGDRVAKHVGVSLQPYGVARGDRQRAKDSAIAQVAQSVATALGFGEIDVYVSQKQPWAMACEMTSPVSLVIGAAIGEAGGDAIRFAAGTALKLAQAALAIPGRLTADDLGVLVIALLRLFQPDFPIGKGLDAEAIAAQLQKLKRLIPNNLMTELRAFGLAIDGQRFDHEQLARDLKVAGLRAGLVASGSLLTGLKILAAGAGGTLPDYLADPVAQGLVTFALGEDHAVVAR